MRAQCRSRSGVTPSKARPPSNTEVPSQAAWVRGPMIGTLPSCQSSSKNVRVFDQLTGRNIVSSSRRSYSPPDGDPVAKVRHGEAAMNDAKIETKNETTG